MTASPLSSTRTAKKRSTALGRLQSKLARKAVRRRLFRASLFAVNSVVFFGIVAFVFAARTGNSAGSMLLHSSASQQVATNPLDQISSSDIALAVSALSGMSEQTAIKNQAESDAIHLAAAPITNDVVSKPQVVATAFKSNKDIQTYVVQAGDTVSSLATKFNVTSDSIRWSNNLSGDTVAAGTKLLIPPVGYSGIVYTVKPGDTLASIASKYKADVAALTAANDAEIGGIQPGEQIIVPGGQQPVATYTASSYYTAASGFAWGNSAVYGYNGYDLGYCTWWVANRREQVGKGLPSNLGNASSWPYIGRLAGLAEGSAPRQYAAVVTSTYGEGHVAFVESVNPDGSVVLSEMNVAGWDVRDTKTISAAQAAQYTYLY